ncbi:hypothetical protein AB3S75_027725 [Citrus x aurantiifolia]
MYETRPDGSVRLQFKPPPSTPAEPPQLSFTCSMVQPVDIIPEILPSGKPLPLMSFTSQGTPVYPDKIDGHFLWDVPGSGRCDPGCPCNDDDEDCLHDDHSSRKKKKKIIYPACKLYLPEDDDEHILSTLQQRTSVNSLWFLYKLFELIRFPHIPMFVLSLSIGSWFHSIPGLDSILGTKLIRVASVLDGALINKDL